MGYWNSKITERIFPLLFISVIQYILASNTTCSDLVYMKIPYNATLIDIYSSVATSVISEHTCLELCRDDVLCKSVGIDASSMDCYLYDGRVYAGLPGTVNTDMVYYWQLEAECPIHLGYSEDPASKICSKHYFDFVNWTYAQVICEMDGGHLFLADTPAKFSALGKRYLIGASDVLEEGNWIWLNGVPVDLSLFLVGQPSNSGDDEHCLANVDYIITNNTIGFNDVNCHREYKFICEVPTKTVFNQ